MKYLVHIGGGLWGIFAVPIFRRTIGPTATGGFAENVFYSIIYRIGLGESWRVRINFHYQSDETFLFEYP